MKPKFTSALFVVLSLMLLMQSNGCLDPHDTHVSTRLTSSK